MEQGEQRRVLPAIPLRGVSILPGMITNIDLNRQPSLKALEFAMRNHTNIFLVTQQKIETDDNNLATLYETGCIARVVQMFQLPNQIVRVVVEGMKRARLFSLEQQKDAFMMAEVMEFDLEEHGWSMEECEARSRVLKELLARYLYLQPNVPKELAVTASNTMDFKVLLRTFAAYLPFYFQQRQAYLDATDEELLYEMVVTDLQNELNFLQVKKNCRKM